MKQNRKLTLDDYVESADNGTVISDICRGLEVLESGDNRLQALIFRCGSYHFYLPYFEVLDSVPENITDRQLTMLLYRYVGAVLDFVVISIDDENRRGVLSKVQADARAQMEAFTDGHQITAKVGDIITFKVSSVTKNNVVLTGNGMTKVLKSQDFPNIKDLNLINVFRKNDNIECRITDFQKPKVRGEGFAVEIEPVNYPKAEELPLKEKSYYFGEVIGLGEKSVLVNCMGKLVSCKYPESYIPMIRSNVNLQITGSAGSENGGYYYGRITYCELPVGSY